MSSHFDGDEVGKMMGGLKRGNSYLVGTRYGGSPRDPPASIRQRGFGGAGVRNSFLLAMLLSTSKGFQFRGIAPRFYQLQPVIPSFRLLGLVRLSSSMTALHEDIKRVYDEEETDGILKLAGSLDGANLDPEQIVSATLEATDGQSGATASILNAWIGSCCTMQDRRAATHLTESLIEAFEDLKESRNIKPDIVTFALAFAAFRRDPEARDLADYVMNKATRLSKKAAGGKRRKILAASRRKSQMSCFEAEENLRQLCGDDFAVLHETEDFVVINKPSGVPCFHKKTTTAGKIRKGKGNNPASAVDISLEDALVSCNVPLSTLNAESQGLVHRLDRGSSGCLVLAKTDEMHALLLAEFFLRRTEKKYLTIVSPAPDASIPSAGLIEELVDERPAKSYYRIQERYGSSAALLEFEIFTGRKHQIRVHASEALSTPVAMDTLYAPNVDRVQEVAISDGKERFLLHASSLSIPNHGINVEAPVPTWWDDTISLLKDGKAF